MEHIAILRQPFFDMILSGEKTIESRWSLNRVAPFERVKAGDVIWLKETSKDITARAIVKKVKFYNLTKEKADEIKSKYGKEIGTDKFEDWERYRNKKYLTLIWLKDIQKIEPITAPKSHGAGWLIIK